MSESEPSTTIDDQTYTRVKTELQDQLARKNGDLPVAVALQTMQTITNDKNTLRRAIAHVATIERQNGSWIITSLTQSHTPNEQSQEYINTLDL